MKKYLLAALMMITSAMAYSQTEIIPIWEGKAPLNKDVQVEESHTNNRISKVTVPALYHFPVKSKALKPAIIVIPGGGYALEAFEHEGLWAAEWFNKHGYEAFVLKYRLPDDELVDSATFVPLLDAQRAIQFVRSSAAKYHIDTTKIGVIGFSAGGHLASCVSTMFNHPVNNLFKPSEIRPDFSILMYPVISMDDAITHKGSKTNLLGEKPDSSLVRLFSTDLQVSAQTPKTLLVHAINDKGVVPENSDRYATNLFKAGGTVTKVILPEGGHGFGFDPKRPVAYWTNYLEAWLKINVMEEDKKIKR